MNAELARIIALHGLEPLPEEGGFFRRTWTGPETWPGAAGRPAATCILYLMSGEAFSAFHHLDSDETWQFKEGDPVQHVRIDPATGQVQVAALGPDLPAGQVPHLMVPAGVWQGARPVPGGSGGWSLIAATCTPGWDPAGFVLGEPHKLRERFPHAAEWIRQLTR